MLAAIPTLVLAHRMYPQRVFPWFAFLSSLVAVAAAAAEAPRLPGVGAAMQQMVAQREIAGAVTVVIAKDRVLHLESTGFADVATQRAMSPDTLFNIMSMTKPVTAVALLMLQDEGKLRVSDPVAKFIPESDPVHKVTIIPRGRALGVTMSLPEKDRYSYDREYMLNQISMLFGGRIAEEVFMNQMTTGASNDFERATQIARDMVMRYGMTEALGPMVYAENEGEVFLGRSVTKTTHMSEQTMQMVDAEVRRIIDSQYALARRLIEENADKMHAMAKALLEWETIETEQIDDIMAGRPPRPPKDWTPRTPSSGDGSGGTPAVHSNPSPTTA